MSVVSRQKQLRSVVLCPNAFNITVRRNGESQNILDKPLLVRGNTIPSVCILRCLTIGSNPVDHRSLGLKAWSGRSKEQEVHFNLTQSRRQYVRLLKSWFTKKVLQLR